MLLTLLRNAPCILSRNQNSGSSIIHTRKFITCNTVFLYLTSIYSAHTSVCFQLLGLVAYHIFLIKGRRQKPHVWTSLVRPSSLTSCEQHTPCVPMALGNLFLTACSEKVRRIFCDLNPNFPRCMSTEKKLIHKTCRTM